MHQCRKITPFVVSQFLFITLMCWCLLLVSLPAYSENLLELYDIAVAHDPQIVQSKADLDANKELHSQAFSRLWYPVANISGDYFYNHQNISQQNVFGVHGVTEFDTYTFALNVRQPIFHYDRYVKSAQTMKLLTQSELEYVSTLQNLILRLSENFFNVLFAKDRWVLAQAEKKSGYQFLSDSKKLYKYDQLAIGDVQEAEAAYKVASAREILAENEYKDAIESLREVTGIYHDNFPQLNDSMALEHPEPDDIELWTELSLQTNPKIAALEYASQIAQDEIKVSYSGHYPSADIVGGYGYYRTGGRFGEADTTAADIGIELNIPIFEGGNVSSRVREAEFRYKESVAIVDEQRRMTQHQTRTAYLGIIAGISLVEAFKESVKAMEVALEGIKKRFEVGTRSAIDVVIAERNLFAAKRDYSKSRYDYILNILRLKQAAGSLSIADLKQVDNWLSD